MYMYKKIIYVNRNQKKTVESNKRTCHIIFTKIILKKKLFTIEENYYNPVFAVLQTVLKIMSWYLCWNKIPNTLCHRSIQFRSISSFAAAFSQTSPTIYSVWRLLVTRPHSALFRLIGILKSFLIVKLCQWLPKIRIHTWPLVGVTRVYEKTKRSEQLLNFFAFNNIIMSFKRFIGIDIILSKSVKL